jgi:hypothetical protein
MLNTLPCAWLDRGNVIPAYAGIQIRGDRPDARVRGNDHDTARVVC